MQKVKKIVLNMGAAVAIGGSMAGGVAALSQPAYAALDCSVLPQSICDGASKPGTDSNNGVFSLLKLVLNIMTAMVGIAAVGGVIYAGILYTSAGGDTNQVKKAKTIIVDVVIGIVAYGLMFLLLNWLVPGGVLG